MRRLFMACALALVAAHASAQTIDKIILRDYDLDSTTLIYACYGPPSDSGTYRAATSGTSTTLTSVPATGTGAFRNVNIGDELTFDLAGTQTYVRVTAKASQFSITVSGSGLTLGATGLPFTYRTFTSGTGDICWTDMRGYPKKTFTIEYNQGDLTGGLNWRVECKSSMFGSQPVIVWPASSLSDCGPGSYAAGYCNIPTASVGIAGRVQWQDDSVQGMCRVGMFGVTGDPDDGGANLEKISVFISADVRK